MEGAVAVSGMQRFSAAIRKAHFAQVASCLQLPSDDPLVRMKSYTLWSFIHGHSFLQIDNKDGSMNFDALEKDFLTEVAQKVFG
ncbi:MAG: hypothetical protein AAGJ37_06865 [Pseudomonadota bacterium]